MVAIGIAPAVEDDLPGGVIAEVEDQTGWGGEGKDERERGWTWARVGWGRGCRRWHRGRADGRAG